MIGNVVNAINTKYGALNNTVLIFTSDNGYYNGEHRLHQKIGPYEEGLKVPLAIRYPALFNLYQPSQLPVHLPDFGLNNDLAPTIADLGGVSPPDPSTGHRVDGQSLYQLLTSGTALPRVRFLLEHWPCSSCGPTAEVAGGLDYYPQFIGIRTGSGGGVQRLDPANVLYMQYTDAASHYEYYDLSTDGYQLVNECYNNYPRICPGGVNSQLITFLTDLTTCDALDQPGSRCQDLEDEDLPPQ